MGKVEKTLLSVVGFFVCGWLVLKAGKDEVLESEILSGNRGNRDRTSPKESKCVWKQGELGQKELQREGMCLETQRIGTEPAPKS